MLVFLIVCVCVCVCVRPASCSVLAEWEQYILQPCRDFPIIPQAAQRDAASTCDAGCRQPALYIYIQKVVRHFLTSFAFLSRNLSISYSTCRFRPQLFAHSCAFAWWWCMTIFISHNIIYFVSSRLACITWGTRVEI